jgi:hypothetical protein
MNRGKRRSRALQGSDEAVRGLRRLPPPKDPFDHMAQECDAMIRFASSSGLAVPPWSIEAVEHYRLARERGTHLDVPVDSVAPQIDGEDSTPTPTPQDNWS